jgi:arginyl-tRNA synthetase
VAAFVPAGGIARVEAAGNGYINAFLDRPALLRAWLVSDRQARAVEGGKTIVEHTNINPNKAAHIGHLRNAVLGDTLVRCLGQLGRRVEVQNYIDDTGVQVADLVVGFRVLRGEELETVRAKFDEAALASRGERFDFVAWDLYAEVTRFYDADKQRLAHRDETLHAMEAGNNPVADLAAFVAQRMVRHHLATMNRIGVRYDLLPKESDILALRFWDDAFARLRTAGAVHLADSGKNAGCWVMDLPGVDEGAGEDQKVIVRSNGTVTYVGKDIAYQMWKFGLLGRDFHYRRFDWGPEAGAYALWETTAQAGASDAPPSAAARRSTTSSTRGSPTCGSWLWACGPRTRRRGRSIDPFSYEMVALTPAAVTAMFPDHPLSEEAGRNRTSR